MIKRMKKITDQAIRNMKCLRGCSVLSVRINRLKCNVVRSELWNVATENSAERKSNRNFVQWETSMPIF
ncbi:hypothetical protein L3Y34_012694 [Caenorhabditis briggsae]|uniref:Uncharacterized protein n=1 Tax=Caenorhabditis briggsae TaxID=6238 RepID=A0AAE9CWX7_CAEBR|nr:hypothetical protein L3Y34_012694 [Caenorhabditis briggsae]